MPAIKCPSCGYRHLEMVPVCSNCGTPLSPALAIEQQPASQDSKATVSASASSTNEDDIAEYEHFLAETARSKSKEKQPTPPSAPNGMSGPQRDGDVQSRHLVEHNNTQPNPYQARKKETEVQIYEPYETTIDIVPPVPFSRDVAIREEPEQTVDPELWKTDKLPWYFPKIKPKIVGTVLHIESKEEAVDYPDFFAAIAMLLVEIIWIMINVQQMKESDRIVMTTIRIQTYDNKFRDARLRGNMRGADVSLGDKVSLWGINRRGVLFINRGFNHTTHGVISTHSVGIIMPSLITLLILVASIYFAPIWIPIASHTIIPFFGSLFSFFHQHPIVLPIHNKK